MEHMIARFEEAYRLGECPRIDEYATTVTNPEQRQALLAELIHTELELRLKAGENVCIEDYADQFPLVFQDSAVLLSLIHAEFWLRKQCGATLNAADYARRFPQFADRLADEFHDTTAITSSSLSGVSSVLPESDSTVIGVEPSDVQLEVAGADSLGLPFASLPLNVLRSLRSRMTERQFATGECLIQQGEPGQSLLIVREGTVEICVRDAAGQSHRIDTSGPGEILGEMSLLTDEPCTASAVATEPVRVLALSAADFHALSRQHPRLSRTLSDIVAVRLGRFSRDALAGKTFFDYAIKRRLGRGGMSIVYEAEHVPSARRVALKMMSHRLINDQEALEAFQREADLIEQFDHPHIIRMYSRFAAFRTYFIALEFAAGESLDRTVARRGPLPEAEVRAIMAQVASALAYAHARQVVHRDIKPSNIMLGPDGHAKLMDFGLATPLDAFDAAGPSRVRGTLAYMAPEQLAGQPVTAAADYFAMGCVVYELLMGRRLYHERSLEAVLRQIRNWSPAPFREHCPRASDNLCEILDTALHPDPRQRRLDLERLARCAG